ncbi:MAG TPA: hypothetical protein DGD08_02640 [Gemmatimonas aurantiaca]|uniref:Uncharacterized protein n=2 Tax=Gemmatimonas aurantiaca TaxID=173480 RepID=C1A4J9_GEMAT|nr:hypothetical protein [Gemmatimonas aurantiaca]BAH39024.1 hypothetical protein GAU_1982 [Gemmatimonas aurantiaca T-27]HCT56091.1 hypothetical protein [Gemmatimonas aurantiaca]
MGFWSDWQAARDRRRRVAIYLSHVLRDPDPAHLRWLSELTGEASRAGRELAFVRRAVGLIVADRDALDDRTAADVAHQLAPMIASEARQNAEAGREWNARWRAYTAALAVRGSTDVPAARLARVLLEGAGASNPSFDDLQRATEVVHQHRGGLNEALRAAFGDAALPEDVRPSALRH